jgi:hypothetical protein
MEINDIIKKLLSQNKIFRAEKYDLVLRDFDNKVELIGLVQDPTLNIKDFEGREMLFPKRWLTLAVFDQSMEIKL